MNILTFCLLACLVVIPYQYNQDYWIQSTEITLYHNYVLPPLNCGPTAKKLTEIGWIEWSGYTVWKNQTNPECMLYVSKIIQNPYPNVFYSCLKALSKLLEIFHSIYVGIFILLTVPIFLFFLYHDDDHTTTTEIVPQNWILHELKQILKSEETVIGFFRK